MTETKNPRPAWAEESTPLTDAEVIVNGGSVEIAPYSSMLFINPDFARDLERRLRHAKRKLAELGIPLDLGPGLE